MFTHSIEYCCFISIRQVIIKIRFSFAEKSTEISTWFRTVRNLCEIICKIIELRNVPKTHTIHDRLGYNILLNQKLLEPYGLPTSCVGREKVDMEGKKITLRRERTTHPPTEHLASLSYVGQWVGGGLKKFQTPTYPLKILHDEVMLVWVGGSENVLDPHPPTEHLTWLSHVGQWVGGGLKMFWTPTPPLNILHDQVMLVSAWVRVQKSFRSIALDNGLCLKKSPHCDLI